MVGARQPSAGAGPQPAGAAIEQVGRRRLEVAGDDGATPRGVIDGSSGACFAVDQQIRDRPRQHDHHRHRYGAQQSSHEAPVAHPASHHHQRHRGERHADPAHDSVIHRADRLQPEHGAERKGVDGTLPFEDPMQEQKGQRQEVQRLQLNVAEMGEVVGRKPEDEPRNVRAALAAGHRPRQQVHGQCGSGQRTNQQQVVAEHQIAGQGMDGPERQRLQQQVIRVRERVWRREEDVGVEDATGQQPGRMLGQNAEIPAECPQVERRIACRVHSAEQGPQVKHQRPCEQAGRQQIAERSDQCLSGQEPQF